MPILHTIEFSEAELARIIENSNAAWLNGHSHVRGADREKFGPEDQLVGQLGEFSLAVFLGHKKAYFDRRDQINRDPTKGDGGSDFVGMAVDVKTSLMRGSTDPLRYHLLVRPRERHKGTTYILALVPHVYCRKVHLVGFAKDDDFDPKPSDNAAFSGAFAIPASRLKDLSLLASPVADLPPDEPF